ncbi:putative zinc finger, CCHC-type containing protein [Tanacetum coccineum]
MPILINTPLEASNDHLIAQDLQNDVEENVHIPEISVEPQETQQLLRQLQRNREAMKDEPNSMSKNDVWELVELPKGAKPTHWMQVASNNNDLLHESKHFLSRNFDMKDLGEASYVIRIEIHRDRANGTLGLSQKAYIERILNMFNMQHCSPTIAPVIEGDVLGSHQYPKIEVQYKEMRRIPYASTIGSLTYAQVCTRQDITYICSMLNSFQSNPGLLHWKAAEKVLRYLQETKQYKLTYTRFDNLEVI